MIENIYQFAQSDKTTVERVLVDENIHFLHFILNKNQNRPVHFTDASLYMVVVRGTLTLRLNEQDNHSYQAGTLLTIPIKTKMHIQNLNQETLEIYVIKAPSPQTPLMPIIQNR